MPGSQPVFYYVDPTEEIASVLRGIKQANGDRVALVLPHGPRLFRNDVNLRLISAYAREGGKEVTLVTPDRGVAKVAAVYGIRVYASPDVVGMPEGRVIDTDITEPIPTVRSTVGIYQKSVSREKKNAPQKKSQGQGKQRKAVLGIAALAVVGLLVAFTPKVTVVVTPSLQMLERQITIPLSTQDSEADSVPLLSTEVRSEVTESGPTTGRRTEGLDVAKGSVLFFNETSKEVHVPAGTLVSTEGGQQFITEKAIKVPAVKAEYFMNVAVGMKAGQAEAPIRAHKPGTSGNIAAGRIQVMVNGPTGLKVVNPEPVRGGTDRTVSYVTEHDVATVHAKASALLATVLKEQAKKTLSSRGQKDIYIVEPLLEVKEESVKATPVAGREGKTVSVALSGYARVSYCLRDDISRKARVLAGALLPSGYRSMGVPDVTVADVIVSTGTKAMPEGLLVQARIPVGGTIDVTAIAHRVAGLTTEQARQLLAESDDHIASVDIKGWVLQRLPRWTPWIRVEVGEISPTMLAVE